MEDTGYLQPTREDILAARCGHPGDDGFDHYNGIKVWHVHSNGEVTHA